MENASKALIIAGGVFIAIVILVIGVELFVGYRKVAENYDYTMTLSEIAKINKEFTKYEGRTNITIQEIVTAARIAQNYNEKYGYGEKIISVKRNGRSLQEETNENFAKLIKDNLEETYECSITYYEGPNENAGLVKEIIFK